MSVMVWEGEGLTPWAVRVDGDTAARFADRAEAEAYAEAKRAEIAKAQPYYVDAPFVRHRQTGHMAVDVYQGQMPNGVPDRWQAELLQVCCDWLNAKWREVQG